MKTKTEAKRQAILRAAAGVFREAGFERASMAEICARVGGSKATLYNYFPSKESLFFEVMYQAKEVELEAIIAALNPATDDLGHELVQFGEKLLAVLYAPDSIAIRRLAIAEAGRSDVGRVCFERATAPMEKQVADFLRQEMQRGGLRRADPRTAAIHLLSLLEAEFLQRILLGVIDAIDEDAIARAVRRAVDVFLAGYGDASAGPARGSGRRRPARSRPGSRTPPSRKASREPTR